MMPLPDGSTSDTPLAPSVEKAFYRKCIELKRRLNEVEAANDEAKVRRARLDRGIMKMRLERAFLLDELRKRMDGVIEGSDGSADEGVGTPPADRPHRDKRRRQEPALHGLPTQPGYGVPPPFQPSPYAAQNAPFPRVPSQPENNAPPPVQPPPMDARPGDGRYYYQPPPSSQAPAPVPPPTSYAPVPPPPMPHSSPYGGAPVGVPGAAINGAADREREREGARPISRDAGGIGEQLSADPTIREVPNGDRRISSNSQNAPGAHQDGQ